MAKKRTDLDAALEEFVKLYPPSHGAGGWAARTLSDDEKKIVTRMFEQGHGPTSISRFLHFIGHEDASPGRVSIFIDKLPRKS